MTVILPRRVTLLNRNLMDVYDDFGVINEQRATVMAAVW